MEISYVITNDFKKHSALKPVFIESYEQFCGPEAASSYYETISKEALCASVLYKEREVYAFSFHRSMYCPSADAPPAYMRDAPRPFLEMIAGKHTILTSEWLTVAPQFIGKFSRIQPVDLILGMCFELCSHTDLTAIMGYSRQDNKMDLMTQRFGTSLWGTVSRFDIPCSVVFMEIKDLKPHRVEKTQSLIKELWNARVNEVPHLERKQAA